MSDSKHPRARRLLWLAAAGSVLAAVGLTVLLTVSWESPRLGAAALAEAGRLAGLELEAGGFRLNLSRGLELRDVRARGDLEAGRLEMTMERLVLAHRLLPLLSGRVVVDELVLERPVIRLLAVEETAAGPGGPGGGGAPPRSEAVPPAEPPPGGTGGEGGLAVELTRIVIRDGAVTVQYEGEPAPLLDLAGVDVELRDLRLDPSAPSALAGLSAEGELTAAEAVLDVLRGRNLSGGIRLAGGHLVLHDLEMPADLGRFRVASLDLDLEQDPMRFDLVLAGDPLAIEEVMGAAAKVLGTARLDLATTGALGDSFELDGRGRVSFGLGRLPDTPLIAAIDELLPALDLAGEAHEPFAIDFRLSGDTIVAELFEIAAGGVRFGVEGAAGLDGTLDLRWITRAPRERLASPEIPAEVLEALTGADGLVHLPIEVTGSQTAPLVRFDRSGWAAMARERLRREAEREIGERASRALGGLLGGGSRPD
jgi:hypothetical protein